MTEEIRRLEEEISGLVEKEEDHQRAEAYLKCIVDSFDGFIYVCSSDNRIEFTNDKVIEFLGRDVRGEFCHKAIYDLDKVCPWCREQLVFQGQTVHFENKSIRNGRWYNYIATPIRKSNGAISKMSACLDITKKKEAEEAVLESERKIKTLMNNLPGMAYRCRYDSEVSMVFASGGSVKLLGFEPHQLLGSSQTNPTAFPNLVNPEDRKSMLEQVALCALERRAFSFNYRIRTASGDEKWVWEQGEGVFSEAGELVALEGFIADITSQKEVELDLREENRRLRSSLKDRYRLGNIVGKSRPMQEVYELILRAASTDANVIISGESGTGKELVAEAIHNLSTRSRAKFVPINCGAIPENLLEREFFGHRKGAYTGANTDTNGYLDTADGGTLFLDELGELDLGMQVKLLRAIEGRGYRPVGGTEVRHSDFRIVAATNRNLVKLVKDGKMREDFFYRVHILPIRLPPLRERKDDIPLLIDHFLDKLFKEAEKPLLPSDVWEKFQSYGWPGNVRELQNAINSYITLGFLDLVGKINDISDAAPTPSTSLFLDMQTNLDGLQSAVNIFEKKLILYTLEKTHWHRSKTADILKLNRRTLHRKMQEYGIK